MTRQIASKVGFIVRSPFSKARRSAGTVGAWALRNAAWKADFQTPESGQGRMAFSFTLAAQFENYVAVRVAVCNFLRRSVAVPGNWAK
jgi:hypothetical protein